MSLLIWGVYRIGFLDIACLAKLSGFYCGFLIEYFIVLYVITTNDLFEVILSTIFYMPGSWKIYFNLRFWFIRSGGRVLLNVDSKGMRFIFTFSLSFRVSFQGIERDLVESLMGHYNVFRVCGYCRWEILSHFSSYSIHWLSSFSLSKL